MSEMKLNVAEAYVALTEKPMLATSAERILILDELKSQHKEMPQPARFAWALSELLSRVSVPLAEHDLIAGRCVDRELTDDEESIFQAYLKHPDYPQKMLFLGSGHCTYSWESVVRLGLPGLKQRVEQALEKSQNEDQRVFFEAMICIYDAIADYMLRYASVARSMGKVALADALTRGATQCPDDFYTALQLLWIITLIDCAYITPNPTLTVGRLDQILAPLYRADLERGRLTREDAAALITDYYCKHNLIMGRGEHQVGDEHNSTTFQRICNFDAPQYLLLAGTDENGRDAVNELTLLFAECIEPRFKNPVVVVRYAKDMNTRHPDLWRVLMEKALDSASMMFYNDDNSIRTYRRMGFPEEDCRQYAHFGCNWPTMGAHSVWIQGGPKSAKYRAYLSPEEEKQVNIPYMRMTGPHGFPGTFMEVLRDAAVREQQGEQVTIDDLYCDFFARTADFTERKLAHCAQEVEVRQRRPSAVMTFGDCFFDQSAESGKCFSAHSKYYFELQAFGMFGTVADCFITVDRLVFCERKLTLTELLRAVDANYEGYADILAQCRRVPKYGSDDPHANAHVKRLSEGFANIVIKCSRPYIEKMGLYLTPCLQSDTWHLKKGEEFGATPDGRLAHTPFSQNARPSNGACVNGLTAMFNSMLNIPDDGILSGALNLDISPDQFRGEEGRMLFGALLGTYFNRGGLHAQVSCADVNELIDAQKHPERHRDLRVRVTGYSGIFVDICKRLQDDIIARFQ